MALIKTIDQLKEVVKISSSIPFATVKPFLDTACDVWLVRFLGQSLVDALGKADLTDGYKTLLSKILKAEGVLAMWLGNAELSVRISDSGFTVERTEGLAPASDNKIAEVKESLCSRGFQYLDIALQYLEENATIFPEWILSDYYARRNNSYIKSARMFQSVGVNIDYSLLRYETMRPLMQQIENRYVSELLGKELDAELRSAESINVEKKALVLDCARKFIANKTAELYTAEKSKQQATVYDNAKYEPMLRPVYFDLGYTGNFYADQAEFYYGKLEQAYSSYLLSIGQKPESGALDWNSDDKSLFIDIG